MRTNIISFLKRHPGVLDIAWSFASVFLNIMSMFITINPKRIIFASFGGRSFSDSPKALYEGICNLAEFDDWELVWAFVEPEKYHLDRGCKVKIDTLDFFKILLGSKVWISNSGMARGIDIHRSGIVEIETWHGTPLKKIGGEENQNSMITKREKKSRTLDTNTIRCAQSCYDQEIFSRVFHASKESILLSDLPRNDRLFRYSADEIKNIKNQLNISNDKKIILYTPTYREFCNSATFVAPPINKKKWKTELGEKYVFLFRAHYTITSDLDLEDDFFIDVTNYPDLNDLYIISDIMISDYSSTFVDYSVLDRPMLCYAYDLDEYKEKRGLYISLHEMLKCVYTTEVELIDAIRNLDYEAACSNTKEIHGKYAPYAGNATDEVIKCLINRIYK